MRSSLWDRMDINKLILVYVWQSDDHALRSPLSTLLSDGKCCLFFFLSVTYLFLERCSLFHWYPLLAFLSVQLSFLILNVTSFHMQRQRPPSLISMSFSAFLQTGSYLFSRQLLCRIHLTWDCRSISLQHLSIHKSSESLSSLLILSLVLLDPSLPQK